MANNIWDYLLRLDLVSEARTTFRDRKVIEQIKQINRE